MSFFREVGKGVGWVAGGVLGGGIKLAGKAVKSEWVEDVGDGVKQASTIALDNAGQFLDGAVKGTYGVVKKDSLRKQEGVLDLKDSSVRTLKGLGSTISYTATNTGTAIGGLIGGDKEKSLQGVKNVGKVAAVIALAVGVVDIVDGVDSVGAEELDTRNNLLVGDVHPETGVPFVEKTVSLPNGEVIGTFPVFEAAYEVQLPDNMYLQSDSIHFSYANAELNEAIESKPSLNQDLHFTNADIQQLGQGNTPEGYTWHHHEESGVLQLVKEDVHHHTGHTGGRELWGGGSEYR
ncbi:DNase/tRNase domain of colicin-like bacteriocin [Mesobacillus persicus]|uniref:DNase/tRNase domain of colicin-like bacteriocin n=1 Tax=Mesobacillus persicus TaxID=930146 RepID=A0A1H8K7F0_9BACI|nr:HNH endonuclease [Mesobacillus persicus]SEN88631.1 DNase/tRNase domain of colicin-like bacteriocin [Mesobacillus persicus]